MRFSVKVHNLYIEGSVSQNIDLGLSFDFYVKIQVIFGILSNIFVDNIKR